MQCHHCQHAEDIAVGKFKQVPFEETPCAKCTLSENGVFFVALDEARLAKTAAPVAETSFFDDEPEGDERLPITVLRSVVALLLSMPPELRNVVCWRFAGATYEEIAAWQGVSAAAVEKRQRLAMLRWPVLSTLFSDKETKRKRRQSKLECADNNEKLKEIVSI
jgi:hypothetical protein